MRSQSLQWASALLVAPFIVPACASASLAIDIALKASFNSAPYLLELLETAAEENSTSYFPILDRIAEGRFVEASTDEELHNDFIHMLQSDGHITDSDSLSSFQFALAIHSAAPRIEAHYQFYNTSVEPSLLSPPMKGECATWVHFNGRQYCSPALDVPRSEILGQKAISELPFDRILGDSQEAPVSVLYADINSPSFSQFHEIISSTAKEGKTSYRVRYRPSSFVASQPLMVNGYGVELALKRTDYIVIDDRDAEKVVKTEGEMKKGDAGLDDVEIKDLEPLSITELLSLGLKASSFVMSSEDPFDTLVKLSQDFPKHTSAISAHNVTAEFMTEFQYNHESFLPDGYNIMWINGLQVDARKVDAFALLEHLRKERKLISGFRSFGFTGPEAIDLLSHPVIAQSKTSEEPQRYDYRDISEGGNVIVWMNNIEKDSRYNGWSASLSTLLQRSYPGQLPSVRRDIHNLVVPVDFTDPQDVHLVVEQFQNFVKRKVPIRFGLVPLTRTKAAADQAKIVYYMIETYGLGAVLHYLEIGLKGGKLLTPNKAGFDSAVTERKLRKDRVDMPYDAVFEAEELSIRLTKAQEYITRLGAGGKLPPIFINGLALPRNEDWLQSMSAKVTQDLQTIQKGVYEEAFHEDTWLPSYFLFQAAARRNPLIIPEDESTIRILNVGKIYREHGDIYGKLPQIQGDLQTSKEKWTHMIVVAAFGFDEGVTLAREAHKFHNSHPEVEVIFLHNPVEFRAEDAERLEKLMTEISAVGEFMALDGQESNTSHKRMRSLTNSLGFGPGQQGIVINGRVVGPIPSADFKSAEFTELLEYERSKRQRPTFAALSALELEKKVDSPLTAAKLVSLVAISSLSETPEGIYESSSTLRISAFNQRNSSYTAILTGDQETAMIQIVVAVDPASELAQRWIPILKVLSELSGVHLKLFLNPKERLQELPVKRFYRHVLRAKPSFSEDGSAQSLSARFTGIPEDTLLTVGMDVPPSWLVAPKDSIHDLDNIKISALKDRLHGSDVEAVYELEHILIEGHSRDVSNGGQPPRGVQLVLGTQKDPHYADTIIMANLGYFQFKANPGIWNIELQHGRSQKIFNIDNIGREGYIVQAGDEGAEVALMSFQGKTLFPRLSRNPGQEVEDVLEAGPKTGSAMGYLSKGLAFAENLVSNLGLTRQKEHADINIFSVASGHLYERMLNIMIVSVMKHTKHSVKFWFIEQFLSSSFKASLPTLAAEYGFTYQFVTYKWPHWLRSQKEKQREIWGYKILFLDVLFPTSLNKVIFVDADQIVRTDMNDLVTHDLQGAPYGFTPMCDSRTEMEGFRFWKQGYWKTYLRGLPYHISALYVVDLFKFRQIAAGDRLRQQYHQLSADPGSLSNLDQDLPNHMQMVLPIHSLPQEWLWCETWCDDESLGKARTIDLCNNPLTKEPKLERARRQVPEWTAYDEEIADLMKRKRIVDGVGPKAPIAEGSAEGGEEAVEESEPVASRKDEL
ncbi:MAG: hypothetical protein M1827_001688 [Pycnora praestabilis]|nr:MAG: hypothetical protein M1827_001688 [Pycnora praestabilis]